MSCYTVTPTPKLSNKSSDSDELLASNDDAFVDSQTDSAEHVSGLDIDVQESTSLKKWRDFITQPVIAAATITNIYYGFIITLVVVIPTCLGNTYEDRYLIPLMGMTVGIVRILISGIWDNLAKITGYRPLNYLFTAANMAWITLTFVAFTDESSHEPAYKQLPLIALPGQYLTYIQGILTGFVLTAMNILCQVTVGKISTERKCMNGFDSNVLFSYTMVVYSVSAAVTIAMVPIVGLYGYLFLMLIFLVLNHFSYTLELLYFVRY